MAPAGISHATVGEELSKVEFEAADLHVIGSFRASLTPIAASDVLQASADTERTTTTTAYVKRKEFELSIVAGVARVKFDIKTGNAAQTAYGRVFRNGVAAGSEQSTNSETYVTKSENIPSWTPGDRLEVWIKGTASEVCYVRNARVYYTEGAPFLGTNVVTD